MKFNNIYLSFLLFGGIFVSNLQVLLNQYGLTSMNLPLINTLMIFCGGFYLLIKNTKCFTLLKKKYINTYYIALSLYIIYMFNYCLINVIHLRTYMGNTSPTIYFYDVIKIGLMTLFLLPYKHINFEINKVLKYSVLLLLISNLSFLFSINFSFSNTYNGYIADDLEGGGGSLAVGFSAGALILTSIVYFNRKMQMKKITRKILNIICIFIALITILLCGKRGPILWTIVTYFLYLLIGNIKQAKKLTIILILLGCIVYICTIYSKELISIISNFNNTLALQIEETIEFGQVSGRGKIYIDAIKQIKNSPLFGSYFLITNGIYQGVYPHNIILEILMTFGFISGLPLLYSIYKALKCIFKMFKEKSIFSWFGIIFIFYFLESMSTSSLYNPQIWLTMILSFIMFHRYESKKTSLNNNTHF